MNGLRYGPPREWRPDDYDTDIAFSQQMSPLLSESMVSRDGFFWLAGSDDLAAHDARGDGR